jgi:hypothetical protein
MTGVPSETGSGEKGGWPRHFGVIDATITDFMDNNLLRMPTLGIETRHIPRQVQDRPAEGLLPPPTPEQQVPHTMGSVASAYVLGKRG